jgi:predicted YcjX-like family ATPase
LSLGYPLQSFAFTTFVIPNKTNNPKAKGFPLLSLSQLRSQSTFLKKKTIKKIMTNCRFKKYKNTKAFHKEHYNKI